MANIHIQNEVAKGYIETTVSLEALKDIKRYAPKALQVVDPETKEIEFVVIPGTKGSISARGICFAEDTAAGKAKVVFDMPASGMEEKEINAWVMDKYNEAILGLRKVEAQIEKAQTEVAAMKESVKSSIKVG